ncbi:MAG TPA: penicillin acylase family protein [Candidatus Avalokitesvara rifleensis]|uniref:penicillin acylase family protein n=1 Tax=Candidatus Avalokitesvara rifleensis TaxID=3367620 RepID=UPI00402A32AC
MKLQRRHEATVSLIVFLIISFAAAPAFSQDGWSRLQVGDEGVYIFRDEFGVPHVLADSAGALFEAFGYVAAQDRLTQLEISRRQARGRLAEVLGPGVLASDVETRREGYTEEELRGQYSVLRAETRELVEAYARGINRWIGEVKADRDKKLPKELWELGIQNPEPWSICDSLAVGIAAGRRFGQRGGSELEKLGRDEFDKKYPLNDPSAPTTISFNDKNFNNFFRCLCKSYFNIPCHSERSEESGLCSVGACSNVQRGSKLPRYIFRSFHSLRRTTMESLSRISLDCPQEFLLAAGHSPEADNESLQLTTLPGLPAKLGSYAVVVSSGKSSSGCAMLLGCPQMGFGGPQPGYEVDLHGGGFDVAGMTFPGVPAVLIGYNNYVAWTVTSGCSDNMDVFIEELNPTDTKKYKFKGEWQEFESRQEIFSVRGAAEDVRENICRSVHGTVFRVDKQENRAFSKKRTFWGEDAKTFESFIDIDRADSIGDFTEAAGTIALSFNLFCAASDGQIGYWHTGRYRVPAPGVDPRLPARGTGVDEWMGFVPKEKLPHRVNPPEGLIVNWNNKPSKDWDNGDNTPWVGGHRVSYILGLVAGKKKITFDDLKAVPRGIESHGTYQQAVELAENGPAVLSILPPGENGFLDKRGVSNPHSSDQREMFDAWQYKPAHFLNGDADKDGASDREEAVRGTNPFVTDR